MKCEVCNEKEAVVHLKQVLNGEAKELHVCADCAEESGLDVHSPLSMTDFLFGMGLDKPKPKTALPLEDKACPVCTMKLSEFHKRSRLGCPGCFDAFADEILPHLSSMHCGTQHVGKVPCGAKLAQEAALLQKALDEAVGKQDFEEAARLRDRLNELRARPVAGAPEGGTNRGC